MSTGIVYKETLMSKQITALNHKVDLLMDAILQQQKLLTQVLLNFDSLLQEIVKVNDKKPSTLIKPTGLI